MYLNRNYRQAYDDEEVEEDLAGAAPSQPDSGVGKSIAAWLIAALTFVFLPLSAYVIRKNSYDWIVIPYVIGAYISAVIIILVSVLEDTQLNKLYSGFFMVVACMFVPLAIHMGVQFKKLNSRSSTLMDNIDDVIKNFNTQGDFVPEAKKAILDILKQIPRAVLSKV